MFRRAPLLLSLALAALVIAVYSGVRAYDFVPIDDPPYVSENPHVLGGLTMENVRWAFTTRHASYWIPLTWISYMADVQLFGPAPGMIHVTNVVLHLANTLLLFYWLRRATGAVGPSAFVAALFAVHPLHVESVAWITERKDVLSTFFMLLALIAYSVPRADRLRQGFGVSAAASAKAEGLPDDGKPEGLPYVLLWFVLGLLAKPMLVTLPLLLLLCDVWPLRRVRLDGVHGWRAVIVEKLPFVAIAIAASAVAFITQDRGGAMVASRVFPLGLRVANAITSYVIYLWQTIWPAGLALNYPYPLAIPIWQIAGALLLLIAVTVAVIRWADERPYLLVGWLWYLGGLVPVIGFVQVGLQPRADRFTYVPLIGIFIIVAWGAAEVATRWVSSRRMLIAAAVVVTVAFSIAARRQTEYWKDGVALWTRSVDVTPPAQSSQVRFELGAEFLRRHRPADAIPNLEDAVRVQPDFTGAHAALGDAYQRVGRTAEAQREYEIALRYDDTLPEIHNNLGTIYASAGQFDAALPHYQAAVRLKPDLESAQVNLGVVLTRLGRKDEAIAALTAALRINPSNAQAQRVLEIVRGR